MDMNDPTTDLKAEEKEKLVEELTADSPTTDTARSGCDRPRHKHHSPRHHKGNWIPGLVLVTLGLVFLAANLWDFHLDNWWALFILIPAFGNFNSAFETRQRHGRWTQGARSALGWGIFFVIISATFLFNISWSLMWPVLLILLGIGFILNSR
jgi:peptidoglycan/LPS O-acetylase OafA/YrhL